MPMTLVKGHYRVVGASPDGDSVRFYPQEPGVWDAAGIGVGTNSTCGVRLRLDAIDALETHYSPPHVRSPWRQPAALGGGATATLLELLGFRNVVRDARGYVTSATPEQTPGYILTRFADKYGRAVATVFPGGRRGRALDGSSIYLDIRAAPIRQLPAPSDRVGVPDVLLQAVRGPARASGRRRCDRPRRREGGVGAGRHAGRVPPAVADPALRGTGDLAEAVPAARGVSDPGGDRQGQPGRFTGVPRRPRRPVVHRPGRAGHQLRHPDHPARSDPDSHRPTRTNHLRRRLNSPACVNQERRGPPRCSMRSKALEVDTLTSAATSGC